ncbi:TerC/Alx family metal homeostasis membrane protein [Micromonospora sp. U56]|uniref:TerC/Alx family metal homeostasis membrane protein n=1 Tax=Micromonospora sp. U56 TaxID=2824900 RepID=UPI001B39296B|nr:TerC/Alx family metal homeostasis membrane protein [Micromonospora sp. U56]MBQ0892276.1 TerC/Alx family metal homeostasis membrane protein [Micromonospora sp. U56]
MFPAPLWAWAAIGAVIAVMLAVDMLSHRDNHVIELREALIWSAVWIAAGLAFGLIVWVGWGGEPAVAYYSGYLLEKALSIDNVFVFALLFGYFRVPEGYQHKVLFWGVIGALAFRLVFIFAGAELLHRLAFAGFVLGAFLIWTGWRLAVRGEPDVDPDRNVVVRFFRRMVPTEQRYHGGRFTVRVDGRRRATLLLVALVAIEATDVVFAIDSVAAILAITTNTFLVWTATAFAVLGLRSLYFCLAGLLRHFGYLRYGLAVLLAFAGAKLILAETPVGTLPLWLTLLVVVVTLSVSIGWSVLSARRDRRRHAGG